ncbi:MULTISPECIES: hypothetical protein [Pseudomonas]|uniref:Uncharacterized protein n=1 Tax=Pseudomonas fluorescens TaxID=294 RepID=A0A161XG59_PSEFL|nr:MULTISPECIES: hypothetical protein [Pseudomonas]KZN20808.1 hypothetical protein A1D17_04505 [Pseudomonas fluorescens]
MKRQIPNPTSKILANAVVGGAGMGMPGIDMPKGMGAVLLYVPIADIAGKHPMEIQADLGLAWAVEDESGTCSGIWFDEIKQS